MRPLAEAAGFDPPVHKWRPDQRAGLRAELDAAFFRLYGVDREDLEYILGTFSGQRSQQPSIAELTEDPGSILKAYDRLGG
jgi:hypothetical protein